MPEPGQGYGTCVILNDPDGPWTAAAYLLEDESFKGVQHGISDSGATLCGIPEDKITIVRHPFWGRRTNDCPTCTLRLTELADPTTPDP